MDRSGRRCRRGPCGAGPTCRLAAHLRAAAVDAAVALAAGLTRRQRARAAPAWPRPRGQWRSSAAGARRAAPTMPACPCACNRAPSGRWVRSGLPRRPWPRRPPSPVRAAPAAAASAAAPATPVRAVPPAAAASAPSAAPGTAPPAAPAGAGQQVEITGGRESDTEQRRQSTAAKIVIGRDEIEKFGDATVGEVLRRLPGVTTPGAPGRGGAAAHARARRRLHAAADRRPARPARLRLESLTPEQIERIEILRAPTAETGARAIAGTINIITREGFSAPPERPAPQHRRRERPSSRSALSGRTTTARARSPTRCRPACSPTGALQRQPDRHPGEDAGTAASCWKTAAAPAPASGRNAAA